jgi:hypothetical protein
MIGPVCGQTRKKVGGGGKNGMLMQTCVGAYSNIVIGAIREQEGRCLAYILKGRSPSVLSVGTAFDELIVETR